MHVPPSTFNRSTHNRSTSNWLNAVFAPGFFRGLPCLIKRMGGTGKNLFVSGFVASIAATTACADAFELTFPESSQLVATEGNDFTSYALPIKAWERGEVPSIWAEGPMKRQAWRIDQARQSTMQILAPLRQQLTDAGYDVLFECKTADCGGFDFRFGTEVLPEPDMHVDLGDFRFLSAQRMGETRPEYVSLLVSRSRDAGFVQVTAIGDDVATVAAPIKSTRESVQPVLPAVLGGVPAQLLSAGSAVLSDLDFQPGSSKLDRKETQDAGYRSLAELARFLHGNPERSVLLVGHTDFEGSLAGNVALSQKRAETVRKLLIREFDVPRRQVEAEGVGFLSPRASNLTEAGRTENRRVEVILTSTR